MPVRDRIVDFRRVPARDLLPNERNWRAHDTAQRTALRGILAEVGIAGAVVAYRLPDGRLKLIDGHLRQDELPDREIPTLVLDVTETEADRLLATFDPISAMAGAKLDRLKDLLGRIPTTNPQLDELLDRLREQAALRTDAPGTPAAQAAAKKVLAERFLIPPFSVLDARQGYWQERKRAWIALGIQSELGRGDALIEDRNGMAPGGAPFPAMKTEDGHTVRGDGRGRKLTYDLPAWMDRGQQTDHSRVGRLSKIAPGGAPMPLARARMAKAAAKHASLTFGAPIGACAGQEADDVSRSGTSIFDPVLCEIAYRWFCPPGGKVLDPFAGGSVRGVVAAVLGRRYVGIDLSAQQVAANEQQWQTIRRAGRKLHAPRWIVGDSRGCSRLAAGAYDFLFSCPPYADLEVYSEDPRDLSVVAAADYGQFLESYRAIITAAAGMLKADRFALFVVGDIRDQPHQGVYRGFVHDTVAAFALAGCRLYNEAVLVTAVGSLPLRAGRPFVSHRKLGKAHQNVLVFAKGDPTAAAKACSGFELDDVDRALAALPVA